MTALAIACVICWVMVLAARPRRPLPGNEVQELVYSRLLGRQQTLALLAFFVTAIALLVIVVGLPRRLDPDLSTVRQAREACVAARRAASDAADSGARIGRTAMRYKPVGRGRRRSSDPMGRGCSSRPWQARPCSRDLPPRVPVRCLP